MLVGICKKKKNGATNLLDSYYSEIDQISILIDGLKIIHLAEDTF